VGGVESAVPPWAPGRQHCCSTSINVSLNVSIIVGLGVSRALSKQL